MTCDFVDLAQGCDGYLLVGGEWVNLLVQNENVKRKALDGCKNVLRVNDGRG